MKLTKVDFLTYLSCPKQYYFARIARIPTVTTPEQIRGQKVHEFIENFFKQVVFEGRKLVFKVQLDNYDEDVLVHIKNFLRFIIERWNRLQKYPEPVKYFLPVIQETVFETNDLIGKPDFVFLDPDGEYVVGEVKTGNPKRADMTELRLELAFYRHLLESVGRFKNISRYFVYFTMTNKIMGGEFTPRTLESFRKKLEKVQAGLRKEEYPCVVGNYCVYCPYLQICPLGEDSNE